MEDFKKQIERIFGNDKRPTEQELVIADGGDQLDKKSIIKDLNGKTWEEVLKAIEPGGCWSEGICEDLGLLAPSAFRYYARAFLVELLREIETDEDLKTSFFANLFFFYVSERVRIFGRESFLVDEREFFSDLACAVLGRIENKDPIELDYPSLIGSLKKLRDGLS